MNTQPWHFHVVTGEPLERVREENTELMMAGAPMRREIRLHRKYEGVHRDRQVEIAYQLYDAMGIREDREMRQDWMTRGFPPVRRPGVDRRHHRPPLGGVDGRVPQMSAPPSTRSCSPPGSGGWAP